MSAEQKAAVPVNFLSDLDITGGNSGSAVNKFVAPALLVASLRKQLFTAPILNAFRRILPAMSDTEREALVKFVERERILLVLDNLEQVLDVARMKLQVALEAGPVDAGPAPGVGVGPVVGAGGVDLVDRRA